MTIRHDDDRLADAGADGASSGAELGESFDDWRCEIAPRSHDADGGIERLTYVTLSIISMQPPDSPTLHELVRLAHSVQLPLDEFISRVVALHPEWIEDALTDLLRRNPSAH